METECLGTLNFLLTHLTRISQIHSPKQVVREELTLFTTKPPNERNPAIERAYNTPPPVPPLPSPLLEPPPVNTLSAARGTTATQVYNEE